ncbi:MAG: hypothetical protein ACI8RD_005407, partial [Bacillariaceae sp.]
MATAMFLNAIKNSETLDSGLLHREVVITKKKIFMRPNLTVHILQKRKVFLKRFGKSKPNGLQISITKLIL